MPTEPTPADGIVLTCLLHNDTYDLDKNRYLATLSHRVSLAMFDVLMSRDRISRNSLDH